MAPTPASKPAPTPASKKLRARQEKPRGRLVVPLPSRPRGYVPGSGPPLQRIRLLPPRDSTAYIVERILLPSPGPAANGKPLPKRMTYIVGWPDLPAARLLVPAMQILEYVSPHALEEWEGNMELELDEDRRKLAQEKEAAGSQRGLEKKARPPAHTEIESAAVAEAETDAQARPKKSAMSLSTPKKARLEDFEGLTDYDDASPSRQLARETEWHVVEDSGDDLKGHAELARRPSLDAAGTAWGFPDDGLAKQVPVRTRKHGIKSGTHTSSESSSRILNTHHIPDSVNPSRLSHGGFTAFNQNHKLYATPDAARRNSAPFPSTVVMETGSTGKRARSRKKSTAPSKPVKPTSKPAVENDGEHDWIVKRLEDMRLYNVEGRGLVRYFQVLWEGDWPPDQNPTWEPEENIPENMVRNYFKRGKKRRKSGLRNPKSKKVALDTELRYSSVSEAFAGGMADDDLLMGGDGDGGGAQAGIGNESGMEDELLVIEEDHSATPNGSRRRASTLAWF